MNISASAEQIRCQPVLREHTPGKEVQVIVEQLQPRVQALLMQASEPDQEKNTTLQQRATDVRIDFAAVQEWCLKEGESTVPYHVQWVLSHLLDLLESDGRPVLTTVMDWRASERKNFMSAA